MMSSAGKKLARSNVLFLLPANIVSYSLNLYIAKITQKIKIKAYRIMQKPLSLLFY